MCIINSSTFLNQMKQNSANQGGRRSTAKTMSTVSHVKRPISTNSDQSKWNHAVHSRWCLNFLCDSGLTEAPL